MKRLVGIAALAALFVLDGCAAPSSRVTDYLVGFQAAPAASEQPQREVVAPIVAGLVLAE